MYGCDHFFKSKIILSHLYSFFLSQNNFFEVMLQFKILFLKSAA